MSEVVVRGLEKSFDGVQVLRGLDLTVPSGDVVAVLGPSGCGKTTLLRIIAGFERADGGTVIASGRAMVDERRQLPPEKRKVTVVPQEGTLFPHLDVAGNVGFGLPRGSHRVGRRIDELLELVGLSGLGHRLPSELSGGQQQRVALARALAPDPSVVLLDEPFSALDAGLRAQLRADVREALHAAGATAVLVTHDQEEALSTADSVAVMRAGRVVQHDTPTRVYRRPADLEVARFVGEAVELPALAEGSTARTALGQVHLHAPAHGEGVVVVRPERLALNAPSGTPARLLGSTFHGTDTRVRLAVHDPRIDADLIVMARVRGDLPPADRITVSVLGEVVFFATP